MADLADAAGRAVAVPLAALARARHGKPMHPRGVLFDALLERHGRGRGTGIAWLDAAGADDVLVRLSRGAGLPPRCPDLLGLAIRVPGERPVDLLLSSTGSGRWTRRVPLLRRNAATAYGSIMAYGSSVGPVWLAAVPRARWLPSDEHGLAAAGPGVVVELSAAVGRGPWQPFGTVTLRGAADPLDPPLHVDAVLHPPPGLAADGVLARFRRPAYAAARAARGAELGTGGP
jgi:hypothetical protein